MIQRLYKYMISYLCKGCNCSETTDCEIIKKIPLQYLYFIIIMYIPNMSTIVFII